MPSQASEGDPRSLEEKNEIGWRELRCDRASRNVSVYLFRRVRSVNVSKDRLQRYIHKYILEKLFIVWSPETLVGRVEVRAWRGKRRERATPDPKFVNNRKASQRNMTA